MAACWTLVHSLWQGLLLVILTGLVMLFTRSSRPVFRYRLLSALMLLFATVAAITFAREWRAQVVGAGQAAVGQGPAMGVGSIVVPVAGANAAVIPVTGVSMGITERVSRFLSDHAVLIVLVWLFILGIRLGRMCWALTYARHIRRRESRPLPEFWTGRLKAMSEHLGLRRPVLLMESAMMKIPAVFGHLKPVIFIPIGLFTQLPPEQAEAILLHELAHIKRDDYLINLLQSIAEHLFFFNPAVRWLSALLREERENCCDEMAIAGSGDKKPLVRALIGFHELSLGSDAVYGMGFAGRRNVFVNRIARIVQNKSKGLTGAEGVFFGLSVLLIGLLAMTFKQDGQRDTGDGSRIAVARGLAGRHGRVDTEKDTLPGKGRAESERDRLISLDVDLAHGKQVVVAWYEGRLYHITQVNGVVTQLSVGDTAVSADKLGPYLNTIHRIYEKLDRVRVENEDQQLLNDTLGSLQEDRIQELLRQGENQEFAKGELAKQLAELQMNQEAANRELAKRLAEMSISQDLAGRELAKRLAELQASQLDTNWQNDNKAAMEKALMERERTFDLQRGDLLQEKKNLERQLKDTELAEAGFRAKLDAEAGMRTILDEIVTRGIVGDIKQVHSLSLTKDAFFVNGRKQPAAVHDAFAKEFLLTPEMEYHLKLSNK